MSYSGWTTVRKAVNTALRDARPRWRGSPEAGPVREITDVYVCGSKKDRDIEPPYGCNSGDSPDPKREFYRNLGFEACAKALKKRWREGEFGDGEKAPPENFCDTFVEGVVDKHRLLQMIDENLIPVEPFCEKKKNACPTAIGKAVKPTGSTSTVQRADVAKVMGNAEPMEDIKST